LAVFLLRSYIHYIVETGKILLMRHGDTQLRATDSLNDLMLPPIKKVIMELLKLNLQTYFYRPTSSQVDHVTDYFYRPTSSQVDHVLDDIHS